MKSFASYDRLVELIQQGLDRASQNLGIMTGLPFSLRAPRVEFLPLQRVPLILGNPAEVVVAVYLGISGDVSGHLMLFFTTESACQLADLLLEKPLGSTEMLDEMDTSALAEVGNVTGSACLNALSNGTGLTIVPTAPAMVTDMAGAILQPVVADLFLSGDEALVIETGFSETIVGHFLILPDQDSMARLAAALDGGP